MKKIDKTEYWVWVYALDKNKDSLPLLERVYKSHREEEAIKEFNKIQTLDQILGIPYFVKYNKCDKIKEFEVEVEKVFIEEFTNFDFDHTHISLQKKYIK